VCISFYALSFLVIEHPIVCTRFLRGEGSSLGNIVKGCWVFPLFENGFPKITSCVLCMVILLVILVTATIVLLHCLWFKFMLN
jgi:hypothetical protein